MSYGDGKLCARIDLKRASQVDEVGLDDIVTVVVKGKVKSLRGGEQYKSTDYPDSGKGKAKEVTRVIPGSIEIEVQDMRVSLDSEFDEMLEE